VRPLYPHKRISLQALGVTASMAFHSDPRVTALPAIAGLVVAYVRNILQYHQYSWDSWLEFLVTWFVHYIAVLLIAGVAYAFTRGKETLLLGRSETLRHMTVEEAIIFGSVLAIVAAAAILMLVHWIPVDINE
jgi:hypothetical protein